MKGKRGLSDIVTTLIIILISIVAIGVVWVVVRNLINTGTQGVNVNAKCLSIDVTASKVNCSSIGLSRICDVQIKRTGTGTDALGGVKLIFKNSTAGASSGLIDVPGDIQPLVGKTQTGINTTLGGVNEVDVTPYFMDSSQNQQLCSQTTPFTFS